MNVDSVAAYLADSIDGAVSSGNTVEISPAPAPPKRVPPPPAPRMWGLKAAGGDVSWCGKKPETAEEAFLKKQSERLRAQLKFERRQTRQGEKQ
jgi:hypothetical protein